MLLRVAFMLTMLPVTPAWAQQAPPRVVAFGGVEWSKFSGLTPLEEEGQTTTGFALRDSGFDLTLGGEVTIARWLGVGIAHEWLSSAELEQSFDVDGFRGFGNELQRVFDPSVTELYVAPSWPLISRVRITGLAGIGFWRAEEDNTLVLLFEGVELSRQELPREHSGTSLVVGVGVDAWLQRWLGVRFGYKYLRMSADDIEQPVHNLRVLALIGFGG